ncbi:hypothetical protein NGRA_1527 [Nosema granulosis]|uniref:Uncharacterized protein n=1 Tax=Nosema granulosis TaxID=83296 RepID=A0A9P6KZH6_9MICR|nr:hypothetical protein NGRA_1527 [Nosema granulosis]
MDGNSTYANNNIDDNMDAYEYTYEEWSSNENDTDIWLPDDTVTPINKTGKTFLGQDYSYLNTDTDYYENLSQEERDFYKDISWEERNEKPYTIPGGQNFENNIKYLNLYFDKDVIIDLSGLRNSGIVNLIRLINADLSKVTFNGLFQGDLNGFTDVPDEFLRRYYKAVTEEGCWLLSPFKTLKKNIYNLLVSHRKNKSNLSPPEQEDNLIYYTEWNLRVFVGDIARLAKGRNVFIKIGEGRLNGRNFKIIKMHKNVQNYFMQYLKDLSTCSGGLNYCLSHQDVKVDRLINNVKEYSKSYLECLGRNETQMIANTIEDISKENKENITLLTKHHCDLVRTSESCLLYHKDTINLPLGIEEEANSSSKGSPVDLSGMIFYLFLMKVAKFLFRF